MITNKLISNVKPVLIHKLEGMIDIETSTNAVTETQKLISGLAANHNSIDLLLDVRGYQFDSIESRRIWSLGVKEWDVIKRLVNKVAVLADETPVTLYEKEMMETPTLNFFFNENEAKTWIGVQ